MLAVCTSMLRNPYSLKRTLCSVWTCCPRLKQSGTSLNFVLTHDLSSPSLCHNSLEQRACFSYGQQRGQTPTEQLYSMTVHHFGPFKSSFGLCVGLCRWGASYAAAPAAQPRAGGLVQHPQARPGVQICDLPPVVPHHHPPFRQPGPCLGLPHLCGTAGNTPSLVQSNQYRYHETAEIMNEGATLQAPPCICDVPLLHDMLLPTMANVGTSMTALA